MNENKKCKSIFSPRVARQLLKLGHVIADIKPDKSDKDGKKSIFVFAVDDTFFADLIDISAALKEEKAKRKAEVAECTVEVAEPQTVTE